MQKIIKTLLKLKKALQNYDADYIVIDVKAKFKPQKANKKNKKVFLRESGEPLLFFIIIHMGEFVNYIFQAKGSLW